MRLITLPDPSTENLPVIWYCHFLYFEKTFVCKISCHSPSAITCHFFEILKCICFKKVLSACTDKKIINDTFNLEAFAYIPKASEPEELHQAILCAANGNIYQNKYYISHQKLIFNPTEIRILELIWSEKTNEEIARTMLISLSTIEKTKHQLKEKTSAKSTMGLIRYAIERRILIPDAR